MIPFVLAVFVGLLVFAATHSHGGKTCVYVGDKQAHCGHDFTIVIQSHGDGVSSWTVSQNH